MVRASAVGRARLQDPDGDEYKVARLLLSLVLGWPNLALAVLAELDTARSGTWPELLGRVSDTATTVARGPGRNDEDVGVLRALRLLSEGAPKELGRYRTWAPHVRRFSMLTRPLLPEARRMWCTSARTALSTTMSSSGTPCARRRSRW